MRIKSNVTILKNYLEELDFCNISINSFIYQLNKFSYIIINIKSNKVLMAIYKNNKLVKGYGSDFNELSSVGEVNKIQNLIFKLTSYAT